jgi:hypothetical protein
METHVTDIPVGIFAILALIGVHLVWVLVPLVPALLIYWLFPNTPVAVSGPLAGLTVRTGGAFGAYLVVLLLTYGQLQTTDQSINDLQRQFWTVKGTVQLVDARGNPIMSRQLMDKLEIRTRPTAHSIDMHEIKLRIVEERDGLPLTVITLPEFGEHKIEWASGKRDKFNRTIEFTEPIKFQQQASTTAPVSELATRMGAAVDSSSQPGASLW